MNTISRIDLKIPEEFQSNVDKLENHYREKIKGIQIRKYGLMYDTFPYKERNPSIEIYVDGAGFVVGSTLIFQH